MEQQSMALRLTELRKTLGLSQTEFAEKIGRTQGTYSAYEKGRSKLPERALADICRVYNVNENWLRCGCGSMLLSPQRLDNELAAAVARLIKSNDDFSKKLLLKYLQLAPEQRHALADFFREIITD